MGVTIDTISIEIESSSIGAAKGIDALAKSLEGLKKNGSFKTVSTNLNSLSDALRGLPNVHQASNSLRTLANSIEKLKGVGTVAGLANSLKKLPESLRGLGNIDLDRVAPQIEKVVAAVAPLSTIKAGGLSTIMNSLKKLGEVTKSLDAETIDAFADKVALLTSKLGPLSEKMSTIKSGFSAINTGARSAASGVDELDNEIDASALNMSSFISIIQAVAGTLQAVIQKFSEFISMAIEWDGIAARFGRSFGAEAEETYAWIQRLNKEMGINVQQFMQYSSLYAQMLTGFGVASKDASKMALGYTELTYDIWASANDRYKTFEDAAEAVASAIAGEVEPIRRAGFTIVEATLAETAAYHGLDISLANATESQKSYLRYLTLVDQAHSTGTIGVYAAELNTAEGMMRTFSQQLKSLAQAFGSLFLPVLVKVMPYLQAFVELLEEGVRWIAGIFGIEIQDIGDTWKDVGAGAGAVDKVTDAAGGATDALDDATKAAKELKNATLGFDELNVISPQSASSAGGGSGGSGGSGGVGGGGGFEGLDIDSLWDESIFDNIQSDVEAIKAKFKDWLPVIATVTTALAGLRLLNLLTDMEKLKNLKVVKFFTNTGESFKKIITHFDDFIKAARAMAPEVGWLAALFPQLSTALSGVATFLAGISAPVWAAIAAAVVAVGSAIYFVVENWDALKQAAKDFFAENIAPKFDSIKESFEKIKDALGPVYDLFVVAFGWISDVGLPALGEGFEWLGGIVTGIVGGVIGGAINGIVSFIDGLVQYISGAFTILRGFVDFWIALFTGGDLSDPIEKMKNGIIDQFVGLYKMTIGVVVEFVEGIIDWFIQMWDILVGHSIVPDTINAIVDWFVSLPGKVLGIVGDFVLGIVDKFASLGKSLTDKFSAAWEAVKTWWNQKPALTSYLPSIGDIASKLSSAWESAKTWWDTKKEALASYVPSIGDISAKLSAAWETAKTWWDTKKTALASYVPSIGDIAAKLSTAWEAAKTWWKDKKSALSYTPSIGAIWEKLKAAWESAKTWWKEKRSSLSYTPSIGKIWENLKSAWENAKTWWSKSRSNLSYTPSIGKIWEKLKTSWTNAKNWWSKNKGTMSYTPSIGSIKDKLSSAWKTAKNWWNSNASLSTKLNVSVPKITVKWDTASAFGKEFRYPTGFSLKFAAAGGIFDQGSLIWAGERGPEVMAEASGGRTGVMNVQQMQEAVYDGVYAAVTAAMRGTSGGGSQEVRVFLDGREISASVKKHQHESGATIMGNEVYAY